MIMIISFHPIPPKPRHTRVGQFLKKLNSRPPTLSPTEYVKVPFFNLYKTTAAYHGDLIGEEENAKEICYEQIENENCDREQGIVFPLLSYTNNYAKDLKIKKLEQYNDIPLYHNDQLLALNWVSFWNDMETINAFFDSFPVPLYLGFRLPDEGEKDPEPLSLNCENWSDRFAYGTTSHGTDIMCGELSAEFLCVCLSYV